jgi:hypothetical protein
VALLGFLMICAGVGIIMVSWGALMAKGWTGKYYERRELRNPRRKI